MNRADYNDIVKRFEANEDRLKALTKGDLIYEVDCQDPEGGSYFKHEVVSVDLDEMLVTTIDHSQKGTEANLYHFLTAKEANITAKEATL